MTTVFDPIIRKQTKTKILYEDDEVLAFDDIRPQAPIHILVIPKRRIDMLRNATNDDQALLGKLLLTAQKLAADLKLIDYRIVINNGPMFQTVFHLHVHLLGGRFMDWPPG